MTQTVPPPPTEPPSVATAASPDPGKPNKPRFALIIEGQPSDAPVINRLRSWLKSGLRAFGMKCVSAREITPGRNEPDDERTEPAGSC